MDNSIDSITIGYDDFSGKKEEMVVLKEGRCSELLFNIEIIKGTLGIAIEDSKRDIVFEKDGVGPGEIKVILDHPGEYKVVFSAESYSGSYNITCGGISSANYVNPYDNLSEGSWYKTNFHTHAGTGAGTCGSNSIESVVAVYKQLKYDILTISNHDIFTDTSSFTDDRVYMIPGVEYSQQGHMLTIGVDKSLHNYSHQEAIDLTNNMGGFSIMAHPNWTKREYWARNKLISIKGYVGIEVVNMLIYRLSGSGLASDTWDFLLKRGRLVYGFGNDDFHQIFDAGRSFNVVYCKGKSYESLRDAIYQGSFCASTGLFPDYLKVEDNTIIVKARYPINTYVDTFTYRFIEGGEVLDTQIGKQGVYKLKGEKYVRVEVIGENGAMLFFQPVYQQGSLKLNR